MSLQNDFLAFCTGAGQTPNVLDQADYAALAALATGFQSGVANSAQVNKVLRQSSIMAAVLAKFIVDYANQPAVDDGTTSTIEANLKAAIQAIITAYGYAPLASPALSGTPTAPTPASTDNSTKLATTAWVQEQVYAPQSWVSSTYATVTWVQNNYSTWTSTSNWVNSNFAPLVNANLQGSPTAPTPGSGDNSTRIATTAFIKEQNYQANLGFTPVQQGGGTGQANNKIYLGWDGAAPRMMVDSTDIGQMTMNSTFAGSAAQNGYQYLPSGILFQWGYVGISGSGDTINFPVTFPRGVFAITATDVGQNGTSGSHSIGVPIISDSQFQAFAKDPGTGQPINTLITWIAIGY